MTIEQFITLIPAEVLERWQGNARRSAMKKIADLVELRSYLRQARDEGERVVMQMYREAAKAFGVSIHTIRRDIAAIGEYEPEMLVAWVQAGLPFEMLREINTLATAGDGPNGLLNASPAEVICQIVDNGNGNGDIPTVEEAVSFALSHRPQAAIEYKLNRKVTGIVRALKLPEEREAELTRELWQIFTKYM